MGDQTTLLEVARLGDEVALDQLCSVMYRELLQLAQARLKRSEHITLLDTTSLVHEAYLRLTKVGRLNVTDRSDFLAYAARAMRSIIVDFVRRRATPCHLDTDIAESAHAEIDEVIRVNDALVDLEQVDGRLVRVVEMRYFAA